ncbi:MULTISPECIES: hypothetical protein [unclassified Acidocella]|uniref:hypothetical protein n=1 Tax=unclassified Acidocella TaxID=2648610 RepID=UPI001181B7AC|nr:MULTISPECIES: hypothetical protein [unclassified Acidocella]WBO61270.1 hypothetical protein GT370_09865 [Acidocella sp. MX-AZ03]
MSVNVTTSSRAFAGVNRLLLISSNLNWGRMRHHQAVIEAAKSAVQIKKTIGAAADGKISLAARADYAAAAAVALTMSEAPASFELAGDTAWTLSVLAAEISRQVGKTIDYADMTEIDFKTALIAAGLPDDLADLLADADAKAANGALFDESGALSRLIGRPTTPVAQTVHEALNA